MMPKQIVFFSIAVLLIGPGLLNISYADQETGVADWQLVYLKNEECQNPDNATVQLYVELTTKYFELYQFENTAYEPNCILVSEFSEFQKTTDLALLIIIFDEEASKDVLQTNHLDGIYAHVGNDRLKNHTVIVCDCSDDKTSFEAALTPWILSHELSHFILSYKGYSKAMVQEAVHEKENAYIENCMDSLYVANDCDNLKIIIRADSIPKDLVVMGPYEPAIGNKLVNYISEETLSSEVIDLQNTITKMWLTGDISEKAFVESVKSLVDPQLEKSYDDVKTFLEIPNGFVISEVSRNIEIDWNEYLNPKSEDNNEILNYVQTQFQEDITDNSSTIPHWFKARSLMWLEGKIADEVFFDGIEHLVRMGTIKIS